jgi:hypothetical protein
MTIRPDLLKHKAVEAYDEGYAVGQKWHTDENAPDGRSWSDFVKTAHENRREWFDGFFDGLFGAMDQIEKEIEEDLK